MNDAQLAVKNWDSKAAALLLFAVREIAGFNKYWGILSAKTAQKELLVWLNINTIAEENESDFVF